MKPIHIATMFALSSGYEANAKEPKETISTISYERFFDPIPGKYGTELTYIISINQKVAAYIHAIDNNWENQPTKQLEDYAIFDKLCNGNLEGLTILDSYKDPFIIAESCMLSTNETSLNNAVSKYKKLKSRL